jgi:hypothetical protein
LIAWCLSRDRASEETVRGAQATLGSPEPPERWVAGADAVRGVIQKADLLRQQASAFPELSTTLDHE